MNSIFGSKRKRKRHIFCDIQSFVFSFLRLVSFFFFKDRLVFSFYVKMFWIKKKINGFWVAYGYPWIIYSGKIRVWILMGIDNWVSMGKLFE